MLASTGCNKTLRYVFCEIIYSLPVLLFLSGCLYVVWLFSCCSPMVSTFPFLDSISSPPWKWPQGFLHSAAIFPIGLRRPICRRGSAGKNCLVQNLWGRNTNWSAHKHTREIWFMRRVPVKQTVFSVDTAARHQKKSWTLEAPYCLHTCLQPFSRDRQFPNSLNNRHTQYRLFFEASFEHSPPCV